MMGLLSAGFLASALTPAPQVATADTDSAALIREGKQLYDTSCVTCHGANLQGVQDRGPSLIGVGEAAVYFQVSSGRMPAVRNEAQAMRKPPKFNDKQIDALGAFINANTAMLTGPQNMPKFSDRQLTIEEKSDIIAYVKSAQETLPAGGWSIGSFGPGTEMIAIWTVGIIAVVGATLWIGARS